MYGATHGRAGAMSKVCMCVCVGGGGGGAGMWDQLRTRGMKKRFEKMIAFNEDIIILRKNQTNQADGEKGVLLNL